MTYFFILCRFSIISDVIQKVQRHHDLIKVTKRLLGYVETIQLILGVTDNIGSNVDSTVTVIVRNSDAKSQSTKIFFEYPGLNG